jgi:hypothetical protein
MPYPKTPPPPAHFTIKQIREDIKRLEHHSLSVLIGNSCHRFGQRKGDMKVGDVERFRFTLLQPLGPS